jgi:protein-tyrosine sulfotransferase
VLERIRRLALVRGWRGVEQTPETAFVLGAALRAYPAGRAVHVVRDGRDVVCSLLERGWLSAGRTGGDDAKLSYGSQARFWVEPERVAEFEAASDATRAAWAWRAYATAARAAAGDRTLELRYELLTGDPKAAAAAISGHLGIDPTPLAARLARVHDRSVGRYRRDLSLSQLADVEREAGPLLRELGYPAD